MSWWAKEGMVEALAAKAGRTIPLHPDEELHTVPMDQMLVTPEERREYEEWLAERANDLPASVIKHFTTTPIGNKD